MKACIVGSRKIASRSTVSGQSPQTLQIAASGNHEGTQRSSMGAARVEGKPLAKPVGKARSSSKPYIY